MKNLHLPPSLPLSFSLGMGVGGVKPTTTKFVLGIESAIYRPGRQESKCQWQRELRVFRELGSPRRLHRGTSELAPEVEMLNK